MTEPDKIDRLLAELGQLLRQALPPATAAVTLPADPEADAIDLGAQPLARRDFVLAEKPAAEPVPRLAQFRQTAPRSPDIGYPISDIAPADLGTIERHAVHVANRTALGALAILKQNPKLADVVTFLLTPLVERELIFDGNAEAILTRRANEFADYTGRHLSAAARHLCNGRHKHFPEAEEIYAAIGKVARPGYAGADLTTTATKAA